MILSRTKLFILFCLFGGSFGCKQNQALEPVPTSLSRASMSIKVTDTTPGDLNAVESPKAREGALLREQIVTELTAQGVAPVRLTVGGKGTWKTKNGALVFDAPEPVIQPENQRIRDALLERMAKAQIPESMPLGPLVLLDKAATHHKSTFSLSAGTKLEGVDLAGAWHCERARAQGPANWKAVTLSCTIDQGKATQTLSSKHGQKRMEGTFLGVLDVIRLVAQDGSIQAQELRMKLFLGVDVPSALRLSSSYQASWCASKAACTQIGW